MHNEFPQQKYDCDIWEPYPVYHNRGGHQYQLYWQCRVNVFLISITNTSSLLRKISMKSTLLFFCAHIISFQRGPRKSSPSYCYFAKDAEQDNIVVFIAQVVVIDKDKNDVNSLLTQQMEPGPPLQKCYRQLTFCLKHKISFGKINIWRSKGYIFMIYIWSYSYLICQNICSKCYHRVHLSEHFTVSHHTSQVHI